MENTEVVDVGQVRWAFVINRRVGGQIVHRFDNGVYRIGRGAGCDFRISCGLGNVRDKTIKENEIIEAVVVVDLAHAHIFALNGALVRMKSTRGNETVQVPAFPGIEMVVGESSFILGGFEFFFTTANAPETFATPRKLQPHRRIVETLIRESDFCALFYRRIWEQPENLSWRDEYLHEIQQPLCLSDMRDRTYTDKALFVADLKSIAENCLRFNGSEDEHLVYTVRRFVRTIDTLTADL